MNRTAPALESCFNQHINTATVTLLVPLRGGQTTTFNILYKDTGIGHGAKKNE